MPSLPRDNRDYGPSPPSCVATRIPPGLYLQLIRASDELPCSAEDVEPFNFCDARIDIPRRWDRRSLRERGPIVVAGENLLD